MGGSVRDFLRNATHAAHLRLDEMVGQRLLGPGFTQSNYLKLLINLHAFIARWELEMERALASVLPGFVAERSKLPMLRADIAAMHGQQGPTHATHAPVIGWTDISSALGSMYVIEGSTLGGQIIAPRLREKLKLAQNSGGTEYFQSYGPMVTRRWREFVSVLDRLIAPQGLNSAAENALWTFNTIGAIFTNSLSPEAS